MDLNEDIFAELIYFAGAEPSLWPRFLGELSFAVGAHSARLSMTRSDRSEVVFSSTLESKNKQATTETWVRAGRRPVKLTLCYSVGVSERAALPDWLFGHLRVAVLLTERVSFAKATWSVVSDLAARQNLDVGAKLGPNLGMVTQAAAAVLKGAVSPSARDIGALTSLFGLTQSEARLAERCGAGLDLPEVAASLGITYATAKFVLQRVFQKVGVQRQADLVLIVSRLRAILLT